MEQAAKELREHAPGAQVIQLPPCCGVPQLGQEAQAKRRPAVDYIAALVAAER